MKAFSGDSDHDDINAWLTRFKLVTKGMGDDARIQLLRKNLIGVADEWMSAMDNRDEKQGKSVTFDEWTRRLREKFEMDAGTRREAETAYKQTIGQSAKNFCHNKLRLVEAAFPDADDASKVHSMSLGVHPLYQPYLKMRHLKTFDLKDKIKGFENILADAMDTYKFLEEGERKHREPSFVTADLQSPATQQLADGMQSMHLTSPSYHQTTAPSPAFAPTTSPQSRGFQGGSRPLDKNSVWFHPGVNRMVLTGECLNCLGRDHVLRDCAVPRREALAKKTTPRRSNSFTRTENPVEEARLNAEYWARQHEMMQGRTTAVKTAAAIIGHTGGPGGNASAENQ